MYIKEFESIGAIVKAVWYSLLNGPNQDVSAVKKIGNHGKNLRDLHGQNHYKYVRLV